MSLPSFTTQKTFFDADQMFPQLADMPGAERFRFFAETILPELIKQRPTLASMYCQDNGRPAEEPVRMLAVLILQFMERLPDRRAAEAFAFDFRWKLALGMPLDASSFHPTSLVKFRNRLLEHGIEHLGFDSVLDAMRDAGYLPKKTRQRLDSTHIVGMVSQMSRLECVRESMRLALEALEKLSSLPRPEAWSIWWERYAESMVDYRADANTLRVKMDQVGKDAAEVLAWIDAVEIDQSAEPMIKLLRKVYDDNFEEKGRQAPIQRPAQPAGAVQNPHDPEAQWSRKNAAGKKRKEWIGYKAHVSETVEKEAHKKGEPTRNVITAVVTEEATGSDKSAIGKVEQTLTDSTQEPPAELYVDAGYTSAAEIARFEAEGRELKGPVQPAPTCGKRYKVDEFEVDIPNRCAVCPAGRKSSQCSRLKEKKTGRVDYRFEWGKACRDCTLRKRCIAPSQRHRTLCVSENHMHLQARRKAMKTDPFKKDMQHRNGVEGSISELTRGYGLRRTRYRGLAKTSLQNLMIGTACNICRWSRRIIWEAKHESEVIAVPA